MDSSNKDCAPKITITTPERNCSSPKPGRTYVLLNHSRYNLDSGLQGQVSDDGYQILEELRLKDQVINNLKGRLKFNDSQYKELTLTLTLERDSLKSELNKLGTKFERLVNDKQDYEKCHERMVVSEASLDASQQELMNLRWKIKKQESIISELEDDKLTLEGLLSQTKAQRDNINQSYSNCRVRQSWYLKENQMLETQRDELSLKIEDQDRLLQRLMGEKDKAEIELRDINQTKSNCARMDTSTESFTEDEMLTKLGSFKDNLTDKKMVKSHIQTVQQLT